jgi:rhodanese-related sulfurtransferase
MKELNIEITPQELCSLDENSYELIDVRELREKSIADIGGKLIPVNTLPSIVDDEFLKDKRLILYCHHGVRSFQGVQYLHSKGFARVQSLQGGINLWSKDIDSTIPFY